ncbi:DUF305 domain-containing protein [Rhizobium sp. CNPSo 4062]|uniref:DUF305 domain-containing protein n=1 Tax=Rhizobium sp. CNPSo 4062 TaxID=3021410 RepID=UPI00254F1F7B|nr:DUF305 domain-containing protein [Rhizobium sp. CNPSo 4062]MDK4702263.1 DUF305 domain-containing protein [Rhizobium sp. CNPSo 4062]
MNITRKIAFAAIVATAVFALKPAGAAAQMAYPDKCKSEEMQMSSAGMQMPGNMTDYQKAAMDGMKSMNSNMMQGMMKEDADVSFLCGMIAHHMGAISMSQVELKYGHNKWARQKAAKIIDEQAKEIKQMTGWLDSEVK